MLMRRLCRGLLSDRFGRKPVLLFAASQRSASSRLLSGFSHSLQTLLVARLFTSMGLGAALPALHRPGGGKRPGSAMAAWWR